MSETISLKVLDNYRIWLRFNDYTEKIINFRPFIGKGFTQALLDYNNFKKVEIESGGGIAWYNGYDFCPNYLRELEGEEKETEKGTLVH